MPCTMCTGGTDNDRCCATETTTDIRQRGALPVLAADSRGAESEALLSMLLGSELARRSMGYVDGRRLIHDKVRADGGARCAMPCLSRHG